MSDQRSTMTIGLTLTGTAEVVLSLHVAGQSTVSLICGPNAARHYATALMLAADEVERQCGGPVSRGGGADAAE